MSEKFKLDPVLSQDTYWMGTLSGIYLLLSKNSLYPWFILVPPTTAIEFYSLDRDVQLLVLEQINKLSVFIKQNFNSKKLNIAAIGNVVSQLHIHIIGRNPDDACWPGVVWGNEKFSSYQSQLVEDIQLKLVEYFGGTYQPA